MKYGVCLEMQFPDRPLLDRIRAAGRCGVKYAEIWFIDQTWWAGGMRQDDAKDPDTLRVAAAQAGVKLTNAVIGSPDGSLGGGLTDAKNRHVWLARAWAHDRVLQSGGHQGRHRVHRQRGSGDDTPENAPQRLGRIARDR